MKTSLLVACALLVGATAFAAPVKTSHATGKIEKYDATTKTLTVKHAGKDMQFVLSDKAMLMRGKEKIEPAALATSTGQEAKIEYVVSGSTKTADKIELVPAAAKPAPAKPVTKK